MHDEQANWLIAALVFMGTIMNPYAAIGAAFGCVFFLQYPSVLTPWRRAALAVFSWAVGYGAGMYWYGSGPPWLPDAFLPSLAAAALGSSIFTAFAAIIDKNGELPGWLVSLLNLLPWRR